MISPIVGKVVNLRLPVERGGHMNRGKLCFELVGERSCLLEGVTAVPLQVNGTHDVFQGHGFGGNGPCLRAHLSRLRNRRRARLSR